MPNTKKESEIYIGEVTNLSDLIGQWVDVLFELGQYYIRHPASWGAKESKFEIYRSTSPIHMEQLMVFFENTTYSANRQYVVFTGLICDPFEDPLESNTCIKLKDPIFKGLNSPNSYIESPTLSDCTEFTKARFTLTENAVSASYRRPEMSLWIDDKIKAEVLTKKDRYSLISSNSYDPLLDGM